MVAPQAVGIAKQTIDRLRKDTATAHRTLESRMNAIHLLRSAGTRIDLVQRYYAFHSHAEAALRPYLLDVQDLQFSKRCRSLLVASSLKSLGREPPSTENVTFNVHSQAEALGALYVLEGSTLGGRSILRSLVGLGSSTDSLSFLDPYGHQTGEYWRSFLAILQRETEPDEAKVKTVSGALAAFAFAELSLCKGISP